MTSEGLETLKLAVKRDQEESPNFHDYQGKLDWIIDRAKHYEEKTGIPYLEIIDAWEEKRNYWYMNYYQDCEQPLLTTDKVYAFDTVKALRESIGNDGFRCPKCKRVSSNPHECSQESCSWKSYGLFKTLGEGATVFVKENITLGHIFLPIAWENQQFELK